MEPTHTLTDARGRGLTVPVRPRRIVSLVPSITEALFALDVGDRVVGVTRFCIHPGEARERATVVGGTHDVDLDALAALDPDLVIVNQEENPRELVERLSERAPTFITFPRTARDGIALIRLLGELTDTREAAAVFATDADRAYTAARAGAPSPAPRVLYLIWRKPWMTVNADTFIHDMLVTCGAINVAADLPARYPEITFSQAAALTPDAVFLSTEPYPFQEAHAREWVDRSELRAARLGQVRIVDGELCCWYGTGIAEGLRYLSGVVRTVRAGD